MKIQSQSQRQRRCGRCRCTGKWCSVAVKGNKVAGRRKSHAKHLAASLCALINFDCTTHTGVFHSGNVHHTRVATKEEGSY